MCRRGSGSLLNTIAILGRCRKTFFYQRRPVSFAHGISHCFQALQLRTARPDLKVSGDTFSVMSVRSRLLLPGTAGVLPRYGCSE